MYEKACCDFDAQYSCSLRYMLPPYYVKLLAHVRACILLKAPSLRKYLQAELSWEYSGIWWIC